jgi:glutaminyl-peptide cyclotransferase
MNKKITAIIAIILAVGVGIFFACKDKPKGEEENVEPPIPSISYGKNKVFAHDTSFYTQGLVIYKGVLYEGTGLEGKSRLMKREMGTDKEPGKVLLNKNLDAKYFGEGITILHDTLYQLTWRNHVIFMYDVKDFRLLKEIPISTEGWGITTDGKELIVSDGSSNIIFYEPGTFKELRKLSITERGELVNNVNELEFINGSVYANRYQTSEILRIDPVTGIVTGKMNLQEISDDIRRKKPDADVLNGIAYDSATKKTYVTGKLWPEMYEIVIGQ